MADSEPVAENRKGGFAARARRPGGNLGPFAYPAFRAIWTANLASNLGSTMQAVGAAWLMTDLTRSHQMIALVQASNAIPIMVFGLFAGSIADNFDRRAIMLTSQIGMLLVSALLALLTWLGQITPWGLLAMTLLLGIGTSLNSPAWQASVRQQVAVVDLPQAIMLNTVSFNLARTVGPALGGLIISFGSVSPVFALNALSRPPLIAVLLNWKPAEQPPVRRPILPAIMVGIRFCAGNSPIRRVLLRGLAFGFGVSGYQALVPAVVRGPLHGSELAYGVLLGLFGIGSISAAGFVGGVRRRFGNEAVITVAVLAFVTAQLVLASADSLLAAAPATFIAGAGWVTGLTSINVAMQLRSPEAIIGRCLSIYQAITFGGMALGSWLWGVLADWVSLAFALHVASGFLLASLAILRVIAPMPASDETHAA